MVSESFETLQIELASLLKLIADARAHGNDALAEALTADAAQCLIRLADLHTPVGPIEQPASVMQRQQQVMQQQQQQQHVQFKDTEDET